MMEKIKWGTMVERGRVTAAADGNATVESCDRPGVVMQCGTLDSVAAGDIVYCWTFPDGRGIVLARVDTDATLIPAEDRKKIEKLQVGARNLLRFSLNPTIIFTGGSSSGFQRNQEVAEWGCTNAYRVYGTSGSNGAFYIGGKADLIANGKYISEIGQSYAMSVWVKNAHATNSMRVCTPLGGERVLAPGESAKCVFIVEGDGLNSLEIDFKPTVLPSEYNVYFWHAKIEIGTVATDWLPAPEDADESYVALTGKPTENQNPGFGETVEVSQVETDTGGRVKSLTARTIKIPNSEATQSAAGLMSAADKTRLDGLEVGSRNLLLNSAKRVPEWYASATGTITPNQTVFEWGCSDAYRVQGSPGTSALFGFIGGNMANGENTSINGQKYATSIYIKNNSVNKMHIRTNPNGTPVYFTIESGETKRAVINSTGDGSSYLQIQFIAKDYSSSFDFYYWHPKIEHGTMVTDWTPAVEEYAGEASVTFNSIRNTGNTTEGTGILRKVGKTVCLKFTTTIKNALAANTWLSIGTLPTGYRPPEGISFIACTTGNDTTFMRAYLWDNDGNIGIKTPVAFSAGMQISGSVTYFVA